MNAVDEPTREVNEQSGDAYRPTARSRPNTPPGADERRRGPEGIQRKLDRDLTLPQPLGRCSESIDERRVHCSERLARSSSRCMDKRCRTTIASMRPSMRILREYMSDAQRHPSVLRVISSRLFLDFANHRHTARSPFLIRQTGPARQRSQLNRIMSLELRDIDLGITIALRVIQP